MPDGRQIARVTGNVKKKTGFLLLDDLLRQRVESRGLRIIFAHVVKVRVFEQRRLLEGWAPVFLGGDLAFIGALRHD